ncbi:unnamed protein product [Spirodela intermedia]|uniref:Uncharacterized protein n=1 Tax=Spirodela intermedia TaxID=51605 RepID=A0A7I8KCB3_SPIIN|nr:unnamed protein product [Spirodela intermedia]
MESFPSLVFISFVMLALIYSPAAAAAGGGGSNGTTVFDVLPQFGLPAGLLPDAVASYSLDEDGGFTVELDRPSCYVQFDSNLVYYERRITGTLKIGSIRNLEGVQVQRLFLWLGVDEIKVDLPPSDYIYFQVGWISKRLSIEDFREVHSCQDRAAYRDQIGLVWMMIMGDPFSSLVDHFLSFSTSP